MNSIYIITLEVTIMLVEFRVENFKNFQKELIFKFDQVRNYEFNMEAIKDNIVKTSLIYGSNGSGKTNLGLALFDIYLNLTDKEKDFTIYGQYLNLNSNSNAKFYYKFKFNSSFLEYKYEKDNLHHIVEEELFIDTKRVIYYNHIENFGIVGLKGAETLTTDLKGKHISFIKYIRNNAILKEDPTNIIFKEFNIFIDNMLLFSSLQRDFNKDIRAGNKKLCRAIIQSEKLEEFELFLKNAGIEYKLKNIITENQKILCDYKKTQVDFFDMASSGTRELAMFYYWLINFDKASLIFIDDFDAFYHNKLARIVVDEMLRHDNQAIMTTHNTSLIDNDLLRPDCYFNICNGNIKSFSDSTVKELRKAHNLEKLYKSGVLGGAEHL